MRKLIEKFLWVGVIFLALPSAWGFSLSGPIANNDDAWQVALIGYGFHDTVAPKDVYEEYRPVVPVMYYASDASFASYYGTAGLTNIDAAFAILNGVMCGQTNTSVFLFSPTNGVTLGVNGSPGGTALTLGNAGLDSYRADLSDFPFDSLQYNYTAQSLGLMDVKSQVLHEVLLELGLADPDRYVWTLHDRLLNPLGLTTPKCPQDVEYIVVQRNFDVSQDYPYSALINGSLYGFTIKENCGVNQNGVTWDAKTFPQPVDRFATRYTAVASGGLLTSPALGTGAFYTGLTLDDVAGLRYLLSTNNVNWEATAPSGAQLLVTNLSAPITVTTLPFSLLLAQAATNDPATLLTNYPGITFLSVTTNLVSRITTNVSAYFTNLPGPYTNNNLLPFVNHATVYPANGIVPFTNWSPVQFGTYPNYPFQLTTRSLGQLLGLLPYVDPATLQALYPDLLLGPVITNGLSVVIASNTFPYFTNLVVPPTFSTTVSGGLPAATVRTNIYFFTNQPGPTVINYDTNGLWANVSTLDLANFADAVATNDPTTLLLTYPGLVITHTNVSPGYYWVTNYLYYLTNQIGTPYGSPPVAVAVPYTNYVFLTNWGYTFGNVFTNHSYAKRLVTVQTTWVTNRIGAPYPNVFTYTTTSTYYTNKVSGDFFIYPTNWCGFDLILSYPKTVTGGTTNVQGFGSLTNTVTTNTTAYSATSVSYDTYTNYVYSVYPGVCEPVLAWSTAYATNVYTNYQYSFLNVVTNHYYTNSFVSEFITNIFALPNGSPGLLGTNIVLTTNRALLKPIPSGDFYVVPTTWCGYEIVPLFTNHASVFLTNQLFTPTNGGNQLYSYTAFWSYTNYTYSIRPGFCEPALNFATNYSTNIVRQYQYYFGNVVTNTYYTNSPVEVITSNLLIWTNALVGTLTNIMPTTNFISGGVGGDFFIPSGAWCGFNVLSTLATNTVFYTNIVAATNLPGVQDLGQRYSQWTISGFTNHVLQIQPTLCSQGTPGPGLRRGVGRIQFISAGYDSILGQFFQPLTNNYSMVLITNYQTVTEYYQRVVTKPDFLFEAQDLTVPSQQFPYGDIALTVTPPNFDQSAVRFNLAGPGTITPGSKVIFNKTQNNVYVNGSLNTYNLSTNAFLNEDTQIYTSLYFSGWGAFDGSTNLPVVYPSTLSVASLMNQILLQVTPAGAPDATNNAPYVATYTASGGLPPYVWSAPNLSALVPGLTFGSTPTNATISGLPVSAGTFNYVLQVTDSANRTVNLNYSITIH